MTCPWKVIANSWGRELRIQELSWNFLRGWVGGRSNRKTLPVGWAT